MNPRENEINRAPEQVARWLSQIEWEHFVTATLPWDATSETADKKFNALINSVERTLRTRVAYIVGKEGLTKSREYCPWHFHFAAVSLSPISVPLLEETWAQLTGGRRQHESLQVHPYNPAKRGIEYILKLSDSPFSGWDLNWPHCFDPELTAGYRPKIDHRSLRQERRWRAQQTRYRLATGRW